MESEISLSIGNILTIIGGFGVIFGAFYKLLSKKFDGVDKKIESLESKFDKKFDALDNKFDRKFELIDKKFDKMDEDIKDLRTALTSFEKNTEHRFGKIETRLSVIENEQKNTNQRLSTIESYIAPRKVYEFKEPRREEEEPKEN